MASTDVFVVGGGPAGLACAIAARLRGFRVMVADHRRPPIDKACGEGLMPDSLAVLAELGVVLDDLPSCTLRGIRFIGADGSATATFPAGHGIGIRRTALHEALIRRARQVGVEMRWRTRVSSVRPDAVLLEDGEVLCRWVVGADGQNSQVRRWARLSSEREAVRRLGLRQHFRFAPWSDCVEIYWGADSQVYVTPVGPDEICVALLSKSRAAGFDAALERFGELARLRDARRSSEMKGAMTVTRRLRRVCRGNLALVGDASGSTDAVTGEGMTVSFRQAIALADALAANDLHRYQVAHRQIAALPYLMGRAMLLMDRSAWWRGRALRAFAKDPALFQRLLSLHVGCMSLSAFGASGAASLGWDLLTA